MLQYIATTNKLELEMGERQQQKIEYTPNVREVLDRITQHEIKNEKRYGGLVFLATLLLLPLRIINGIFSIMFVMVIPFILIYIVVAYLSKLMF